MIALVLLEILFRTHIGVIFCEFAQTSAKTGIAPIFTIDETVARKVRDVTRSVLLDQPGAVKSKFLIKRVVGNS